MIMDQKKVSLSCSAKNDDRRDQDRQITVRPERRGRARPGRTPVKASPVAPSLPPPRHAWPAPPGGQGSAGRARGRRSVELGGSVCFPPPRSAGRLVRGVYLKRGCRRLSRGLRFAGGPGARHMPPGLSRPPRFGPSAVTVAEASFPSPRPPTRTHCGQVALILRSLHLRGLPMGHKAGGEGRARAGGRGGGGLALALRAQAGVQPESPRLTGGPRSGPPHGAGSCHP